MIQYIFLDLDGTLTDPMLGITNSVIHALKHFGIYEHDRSKLTCFIGPPLVDSFIKYYRFTPEQAREALCCYREYYSVHGIYENKVYPCCETFLQEMKALGIKLIVASSKPQLYVKQILDHFNLSHYFHFIGGSDMEETRVKKSEVIAWCLEQIGTPPIEHCVMVGDREHDVLGAKHHGMKSIGVLYGFGSEDELKAAGADRIASNFRELKQQLLNL